MATIEATNSAIEASPKKLDTKDVESPSGGDSNAEAVTSPIEVSAKRKCCGCGCFKGNKQAEGLALLGCGRGPLVMSNIFLSSAFIYLARIEAGCMGEDNKMIENCDKKVYGMKPSSFVSAVAVISGLMAAFLMPITGAMVDYTPYRKLVGILSAASMMLIQAAQIGTVVSTWFVMAIFQAIAGFLYQVQVLSTYAYLPEVAREVGQDVMAGFTSLFQMIQFSTQAGFLVLVIALGAGLKFTDDHTGQLGQGINFIWTGTAFIFGWRLMNKAPASHTLPDGHYLLSEGFVQIFRTGLAIFKYYRRGLMWYFAAVMFAEAGANAFTTVSVTYLVDTLEMNSIEIGAIFLVTLVSSIPGTLFASFITRSTNPNTSWKLSMATFIVFTIIGALVLDRPERKYFAFLFAVSWGICLGWFYPTENLIFAMTLPKGQEAELSGFFVYCTQVIVWLPPLIFTWMNEANINQKYGLMSINIFFFIAIVFLMLMAPWDEVVEESSKSIEEQDQAKVLEVGEANVEEQGSKEEN